MRRELPDADSSRIDSCKLAEGTTPVSQAVLGPATQVLLFSGDGPEDTDHQRGLCDRN